MERAALGKLLLSHGIQPSAQRLVVADYVLEAHCHPCADRVLAEVRSRIPMISRATVYNTLNLLLRKGLLRQLALADGRVAFDPNLAPHHHFLDETTGAIHDIPWEALEVRNVGSLRGLTVREYQVVVRGTPKARGAPAPTGGGGRQSPRAGHAPRAARAEASGEAARSDATAGAAAGRRAAPRGGR